MDPVSQHVASSASASHLAGRRVQKDKDGKARPGGVDQPLADRADLEEHVEDVQSGEASRSVKGNEEEESHEDRQGRAWYDANGVWDEPPARPTFDAEG